jgi:hypothetical protein
MCVLKMRRKNFYEVFDHFPKYHMKILLQDLNAKLGRQDIFKLSVGNESLNQVIPGNSVRVVNLSTLKHFSF